MSETTNEVLEKFLNLMPASNVGNIVEVEPAAVQVVDNQPVDPDEELVKSTLRNLIEKSEGVLENAIEVARESEHPRAYEVVGELMRTIADIAGKLGDQAPKTPKGGQNIEKQVNNQNLFVSSTEDLIKLIKNTKAGD